MQTAQQVFDYLAKQNSIYGNKYVLLDQPYINNYGTDGEVVYTVRGVTMELIEELQREGYTDSDGYPDAPECYELVWWPTQYWLDSGDDDESNACDWEKFEVYDSLGKFVEEIK